MDSLKGLRVLEIYGLVPLQMTGQMLADQGASVLVVRPMADSGTDYLMRGKGEVRINLKKDYEVDFLLKRVIPNTDVLIESFRPGVLDNLRFGPDQVHEVNKKVIYVRISGYSQMESPY